MPLRLFSAFVVSAALLGAPRARADARTPSLFLSCRDGALQQQAAVLPGVPTDCFQDFLRPALSYFDFTRDPFLADYVIVIARERAGSGGDSYGVELVTGATGARKHLTVALATDAPVHAVRARLLSGILRLLHAELWDTPHADAFAISLPRRGGPALSALDDPWNYWVFAPEITGLGEGGSGYYFAEGRAGLTIRRITDGSKLRVHGGYSRVLSSYLLEDGSRIYGDVYGWDGRAVYAHSVGQHWAIGALAATYASEYENVKAHVHGGPLIELNVFPYVESASQQLRVAYQAGAWANWYFEESAGGSMQEVRPYHALSVIADFNQPWGGIQWVNQINAFIDAPELYRLSTGAIWSLRLVEGLAINLSGKAALVRDQITLRARPVTDEELLLATAQQPTDYTLELGVGLTYTFGSVHNTIVNPRFGRVDLEEE
jgi:hypothetical protein